MSSSAMEKSGFFETELSYVMSRRSLVSNLKSKKTTKQLVVLFYFFFLLLLLNRNCK